MWRLQALTAAFLTANLQLTTRWITWNQWLCSTKRLPGRFTTVTFSIRTPGTSAQQHKERGPCCYPCAFSLSPAFTFHHYGRLLGCRTCRLNWITSGLQKVAAAGHGIQYGLVNELRSMRRSYVRHPLLNILSHFNVCTKPSAVRKYARLCTYFAEYKMRLQ